MIRHARYSVGGEIGGLQLAFRSTDLTLPFVAALVALVRALGPVNRGTRQCQTYVVSDFLPTAVAELKNNPHPFRDGFGFMPS